MRVFLFLGCIALSIVIAFSSLSDVRAESQDNVTQASMDHADPVHTVIEKQLRAFREKDAGRAYAYNSSKFKSRYRDENHFMRIIRLTYQPLTSHLSYTFLDTSEVGDTFIQKVEVLNKNGASSVIMIYLTQNERGTWMIDGYTILDSEDAQPI